ncbi:hypothetical protein MRCP2_p0500 (plasmid) [Aquipseudomonas alcaligenes]|nr:hypothetical protein MRCP2_p0500 [Pseudomonas alcaligenes]
MSRTANPGQGLSLWAVYSSPADFPGQFVARRWQDNQPTSDLIAAEDLEELRRQLPPGLYRLARHPADDPVLVETWV